MSTAAAAALAPTLPAPAPSSPAPTSPAPTSPAPSSPATSAPAPSAPAASVPNTLDPLGDEIALLCAHITAATYRLLCLLKVYDEEERWQGFRSCAHWLSWRTGISLGPAREKVRVARCLPSLSLIPDAFARGEISYSKVRAMTRIADAENEAELLEFARHGTTAHVEKMVRYWRRIDRGDASRAAREERRGLSLWLTEDGSYEVRGRLNPEVGALLLKALEVAETRLYRAERNAGTAHRTSAEQRRADALGLWLEERVQPQVQLVVHSFAGGQHGAQEEQAQNAAVEEEQDAAVAQEQDAPAEQAQDAAVAQEQDAPLEQEQDAAVLLVTEDGSRVSAETSSRLACDAEVVPIARAGDGSVLDVGRRRRTVGWRLRKALEARDGGCRFPGCDSRARTHAHHITPWAHGGETAMNNLVLLCPFHHRAVHEGGWRVEMDEWGTPRFSNPLGVPLPVQPEPSDIGDLVPASPDIAEGVPRGGSPTLRKPSLAPREPSPAFRMPSSACPKAPVALPLASPGTSVSSSTLADPPPPSAQDFGLRRWHGQDGIDAWTGDSLWTGERIDWGYAMMCLWREGGQSSRP